MVAVIISSAILKPVGIHFTMYTVYCIALYLEVIVQSGDYGV